MYVYAPIVSLSSGLLKNKKNIPSYSATHWVLIREKKMREKLKKKKKEKKNATHNSSKTFYFNCLARAVPFSITISSSSAFLLFSFLFFFSFRLVVFFVCFIFCFFFHFDLFISRIFLLSYRQTFHDVPAWTGLSIVDDLIILYGSSLKNKL